MTLTAIATEIHTLLQTPADRWMIGAWHVGRFDTPDRYVWVPTISQFEDPQQASNASRSFPRNIATHRMTIEVHIWGDTLDNTITKLHAFYAAARQVGRVSTRGNTARWDNAEINESGYLVIVPIELALPITDASITQWTTAHITATACDPTPSPDDGYIDCPCP